MNGGMLMGQLMATNEIIKQSLPENARFFMDSMDPFANLQKDLDKLAKQCEYENSVAEKEKARKEEYNKRFENAV